MGTTIGSGGGGGRGTTDYEKLKNKPSINGQTLEGNMELQGNITPEQMAAINQAAAVVDDVHNLSAKVNSVLSLADAEVIPTTYIKANTIQSASQNWTSWKFLNNEGTLTSVKAKVWGNSTDIYAITFFDSEELLLSHIMPQSVFTVNGFDEFVADVPVGCKMVIVSSRTASGSGESAEIPLDISVRKNADKIAENSDSINIINDGLLGITANKAALIGDNISTYKGYIADMYATHYYYPDCGGDLTSVKETWWWKLFNVLGAAYVNLSYEGSRVTNTRSGYPSLCDRLQYVGDSDFVVVALGTNDSRNRIDLGDFDWSSNDESKFRNAYIKAVRTLLDTYSPQKIMCVILNMKEDYASSIKTIANHYGVPCVESANYDCLDGQSPHPSKSGMVNIFHNVTKWGIGIKESNEESYDSVGSPHCFVSTSLFSPSDMTWVGESLVAISSQQGDATDYDSEPQASIYVNKFANGIEDARTYTKRFYHKFGHANTIDYNKFNDCLILGNGSGSYTLDGDIIVIPNFSQLIGDTPADSIVTLADANALIIHCGAYNLGTKFNLVWGDDNDKEYNIAYLITANYGGSTSANGGDLEIVRKIVLCKGEEVGTYGTVVSNDTPFNGTFNIVGAWVQETLGYPNCDQGTCYHNGEIFAAIGHDGLWYWRMRLGSDGKIYRKSFKQAQYGHTPNNVSGICVKDGYLFLGRQNVGVTAFNL